MGQLEQHLRDLAVLSEELHIRVVDRLVEERRMDAMSLPNEQNALQRLPRPQPVRGRITGGGEHRRQRRPARERTKRRPLEPCGPGEFVENR
jgi:hypothetical protein